MASSLIEDTDVLVPSPGPAKPAEKIGHVDVQGKMFAPSLEEQPQESSLLFGPELSPSSLLPTQGQSPQFLTPVSSTQAVETEYRRLADSAAASVPSIFSGFLLPELWKQKFFWPNQYTTNQCVCLMRFYVEKLAPWVRLSPFSPLMGANSVDSSTHVILLVTFRWSFLNGLEDVHHFCRPFLQPPPGPLFEFRSIGARTVS